MGAAEGIMEAKFGNMGIEPMTYCVRKIREGAHEERAHMGIKPKTYRISGERVFHHASQHLACFSNVPTWAQTNRAHAHK